MCLTVCGYCSLAFGIGVGNGGIDAFAVGRLTALGVGGGACLMIGVLGEDGVGDGTVIFTLGTVCWRPSSHSIVKPTAMAISMSTIAAGVIRRW